MKPERIEELRALCDAAWKHCDYRDRENIKAALIVQDMRTALPEALEEVERLRAFVETVKTAIGYEEVPHALGTTMVFHKEADFCDVKAIGKALAKLWRVKQ